ncbi:hypothetical protein [Cryptosporangium arvum]|uniref:hypothetical protein n=1 Tax=Cryptosporangium arvum TaxID=80871 RepID=UPI0004B20405|nr:hypothetical protein [Cryptosporangium arvum]
MSERTSPWARPAPGQAPAEIGLATPAVPEVLASPNAVAAPPPVPQVPGDLRVPGERHPADPDEAPSSKAWAVLTLGVVGVLLMFCGGGLVPGLAGLALVRPARTEIAAAAGFLTGGKALRAGEILSWIAVAVSAIVIVVVVVGLLIGSVGDGPHYDENVN